MSGGGAIATSPLVFLVSGLLRAKAGILAGAGPDPARLAVFSKSREQKFKAVTASFYSTVGPK